MALLPPAHRRARRAGAAAPAPVALPLTKLLLFGPAFQEGLAFTGACVHSRKGGICGLGAPIRGAGRPSVEEEVDLNIKKKAEGDVMVLYLSGKIMGGPDHEKFHSEIKTLIKEGFVDILLNMSKVSWINSTGLGVLVSAFHTLKKNGGQLKICEVSDRIDNILNVTQLKLVFQTFESCEEALQSFAQP
jgi:anti-sigma B factor antagonist